MCREQQKQKDTLVQAAVTFSPDFNRFHASYKGGKFGEGTLELEKKPRLLTSHFAWIIRYWPPD